MTVYERTYKVLRFLEHPLYSDIHGVLSRITTSDTRLLDIGGRTSPQTIGLPCSFTISELPRQTSIQERLNLGADAQLLALIRKRRSNVREYIFDDMTCSNLPDGAFDIICAVEVLEHVPADELFVESAARKLTPGGTFLMSTPNGDHVTNNNPDHVRHYTKDGLQNLLSRYFRHVDVRYAVICDPFMRIGYKLERKLKGKLGAATGGLFYSLAKVQATLWPPANRSVGTLHLIAQCSNLR